MPPGRFKDRRPPSILSLVHPSPTLSSSYLSTALSSQEVPIFLFEPTPESSDVRLSIAPGNHELALPSSDSFDTILSAGTFGQHRRTPQDFRESLSVQSEVVEEGSDSETTLTRHIKLERLNPSSPSNSPIRDCVSPSIPSLSLYESDSTSPQFSLKPCSLRSRPNSYYFEYSDSEDLPSSPTIISGNAINRDSLYSLPTISTCVQTQTISPTHPSQSTEPLSLMTSSRPPSLPPSPTMSRSPDVQLPVDMSWLRDIVLDMLVDQEGFRSVTPSFRFVGYSNNTRSLDPSSPVEGGVAEFMPLKRQTFNFHYGPFDGMPILRRITVNGQSRDYISRQATLSLKSNGVYTVRGIETSHTTDPHSREPSKLRWKFDYLVDDRKGSRVPDGEKTFTPLTFACSPLLLHPNQGKKIRLMQVMKKSVVTKLVAEKMEHPRNPNTANPPAPSATVPTPQSPGHLSSALPSPIKIKSAASLWITHRRAQSHTPHPHQPPQISVSRPQTPVNSPLRNTACTRDGEETAVPVIRRRRASSAGERRRVDFDGLDKCKSKENQPLVDRHIVPPSKLALLLEKVDPSPHPDPERLRALSPSPRPERVRVNLVSS
ncbi:hypothetical protein VKT23_005407 [Stygiomarasmius scandens]|uniref:NDT80 domain-containing protein n=1 Tax=Marasmiellus scandens TaxID=2682957 RepID=A0ABR1JRI8_9AGAR